MRQINFLDYPLDFWESSHRYREMYMRIKDRADAYRARQQKDCECI